MFIGSRGDSGEDVETSVSLRDQLVRTTFVIYPDGDRGFWDADAEGFDTDRYEDTRDRVVAFFGEYLPPRV